MHSARYHISIVSSAMWPDTYLVWCVFSRARRKDLLRKIAADARKAVDSASKLSFVGGDQPIELPLCGGTRYVTGFDGDAPIYGEPPLFVPVNQQRPPGPKRRGSDRDKAFDCLVSRLDPSDYDQWVKCGHLLIAAFGKEDTWAYERWSAWSATSPSADPPYKLRQKWDRSLDSKDGAAERVLLAEEEDAPLHQTGLHKNSANKDLLSERKNRVVFGGARHIARNAQ